jgi:hypothetical protein
MEIDIDVSEGTEGDREAEALWTSLATLRKLKQLTAYVSWESQVDFYECLYLVTQLR